MASLSKKIALLLIAPFSFFFLTGFLISPQKVKQNAFGPDKRFAVVSIVATNKITSDSKSGGMVGMFKGLSKKQNFSEDSSSVFADSIAAIMGEFENSKSFGLIPKSEVLANPTYQATPPDKPKKWFGVTMVPAEGYKYFKDKKKIKKLAQDMGVDGIIVISVSYRVAFTGANISGISGVGKQKGSAIVAVYGVDKNGDVVWKHAAEGKGDYGTFSTGGAANFTKLHASLVQASRDAAQKVIEKLDKKVH